MSDADVDILIRLKGDAERRVKGLLNRLESGGPVAKRFGSIGGKALGLIQRNGNLAAVAIGGVGRVAVRTGSMMNRALGIGVRRLVTTVKWATLAGAAFAAWQIGSGVSFNTQLEKTNVALAVMYRSQARSNREMARTLEFSARTPFQFGELTETVRMLEAFNLSAAEWLTTVGNLASGVARPIDEVARALGFLSAGRTGEAAEALARMGVNLRNLQGLQWNSQGSLLTDQATALRVIKDFLDKRYGGMMEKQSRTFGGALSTMRDNIALLRGEATKPIFERLRDKLREVNAQWGKLMETPLVKRFVSSVQSGLGGAMDFGERILGRFGKEYESSGSLKEALGAAWDEAWPVLQDGAVKFAKLLAEALKEALGVAWKGFWGASPGAKLAIGTAAGLMLAPHAVGVGKALMWGASGAGGVGAGRAVGTLGIRGLRAVPGMIGSRGVFTQFGLETAAGGFSKAVAGSGSGIMGALAGTSGAGFMATMGAVLVPMAVAAAVGYIGKRGIEAWSEKKYQRNVARINDEMAPLQEKYQIRMSLFSEIEGGVAAALERGAAAYAELLQIQERMQQAFEKFGSTLKGLSDSFLDKLRSPAEIIAERTARATGLTGDRQKILGKIVSARQDVAAGRPPEDAARAIAILQQQGLSNLAEEAKLRYEILGIERDRAAALREQNRQFGRQVWSMKGSDRERLVGLSRRFASWSGRPEEFLASLSREDRGLAMRLPQVKDIAPEAGEAWFRGARGVLPSPLPSDHFKQQEADERKRLAAEAAKFAAPGDADMKDLMRQIAENTKDAIEKERKITVEVGEIEHVIKADVAGNLDEAIKETVDDLADQISARVEEGVKREWAIRESGSLS